MIDRQPRRMPARFLVADLWLNPEDNGRHAYTTLHGTTSETEADEAVLAAEARYGDFSTHRVWAIDLLDPEQVKDISELFAEIGKAMEDIA